MNAMTTKTNCYQELIKTMKREKGMKQILVTDNTAMKEISEVTNKEANKLKG